MNLAEQLKIQAMYSAKVADETPDLVALPKLAPKRGRPAKVVTDAVND